MPVVCIKMHPLDASAYRYSVTAQICAVFTDRFLDLKFRDIQKRPWSEMSTAPKRQVYGRGRGDPVLVKSAVDDLRAVNFKDLVLLRSADMGSLAFVFGYCGQGYPCSKIKSTLRAKLTIERMSAKIISNLVNY